MKGLRGLVGVVLVVAVLLAGGFLLPAAQADASVMPVTKQLSATLYPATAGTGAATVYSSSPRLDAAGRNVASTVGWSVADVFITTDIATSGTLTATVQFSADNVNWASADYEYGDSSINTQIYRRVMTADGTEYLQVPIAGEYLRVALQRSASMTNTVMVVYRN